MGQTAEAGNYPQFPEVLFEYQRSAIIPILALDAHGHPYSGRAFGSVGAVEWYGVFVDGLPHGEFDVDWGGIREDTFNYSHGQRVN